ncbi:hypothetical protein D9M69_693740 [compost metagenome]
MAHPVHKRRQPVRLGSVEDVAPLGPLGHQAGLLQGLEVLGDRTLRDAASPGQFGHGDLLRADDALENGPPGRVGEGAHDGIDGGGFGHGQDISYG